MLKACLLACLISAPIAAEAACAPSAAERAELAGVLEQHNAARAQAGLPALAYSEKLARAAQAYACVMAKSGWFGHSGPDGRRFSSRIRAEGCPRNVVLSENIAQTYGRMSVMKLWLESKGHRANILRRQMGAVGFGVATGGDGKRYWVADFAARCP